MNQELFSETQSEFTEYTDENSNFNYELDDDDDDDEGGDNDDESDEENFEGNTNEMLRTSAALQKRIDDDFETTSATAPWDDESDCYNIDHGFEAPLSISTSESNAHGVVHVRLLRARNLPCPVGSSVGATVSLPPYKGKVKSTRTKAFLGPSFDHGVCVRWGRERREPNGFDDNNSLDDEDDFENDDNLLSMVNAWNGPNSPIPSIKIDLTFSPLGFGVFDFTMASIELSSDVLLKKAGVWRTRWCKMKISSSSSTQSSNGLNEDPIIRIQALFVPSLSPEQPVEQTKITPKSSNQKTTNPQQSIVVPPPPPPRLGQPAILQSKNERSGGDTNNAQLVVRSSDNSKMARENNISDTTEGTRVENDQLIVASSKKDFWDPQELLVGDEETVSVNEDTSSVASKKTTSSQKTRAAAAFRSPHLLQAQTYWTPAKCAVCSKLLMGIVRNGSGFRCEVCGIDVCGDCRLNVDLMVPCGSDLASDIVEASFRNKMSASGLLSYIAPDEAYEEKRQLMLEQEPSRNKISASSIISSKQSLGMTGYSAPVAAAGIEPNAANGIGRCRIEIIRACVFQESTTTLEDFSEQQTKLGLRKGDYYVRVSVSDSERSARTPTLQKTRGMPNFRSAEMRFSVSHYGVEFRIDVVEADTDAIVGSTFLTTQGILQEQRDAYIAKNGASLLQFLKGPIPWMETRKVKLKLRAGIKASSTGDEYFSYTPKEGGAPGEGKGLISGWIEVSVGLEEFCSRLYGQNPIECPNRPPADLNMSNFSNYIGRIKAIIDDVNHAVTQYQYMVSWENPFWTATSLYTFIWFCVHFDTEYIGSLPIFFAIMYLVYCAYKRNCGRLQSRFIQRAAETMQKVEGNLEKCKIYRPRGTVTVSVDKGRNLLSPDLGIAGNTSCKVLWDPLRLADERMKEHIAQSDVSADTPFEMGTTATIYTSDPDWTGMEESPIAKRLNQLLPSAKNDFFEGSSKSNDDADIQELTFPILQPLKSADSKNYDANLASWESSHGAIVLQVKFQDFFNNLPGFDHILGEVVIPLGELRVEREIKAWFQILSIGTTSNYRLEDYEGEGGDLFCGMSLDPPRVHVTLKWDPPTVSSTDNPSGEEREMSNAIQEELLRSSIILKESKINLVDSSIGAVSKALGIGGTVQVVQNTLGSIIDIIEGLINILNFTDPYKSSIIFVGLLPVWIVFRLIPTRYIVLVAGLAQYAVTFIDRFGADFGLKPEKQQEQGGVGEENKGKPNPFMTKINNALRSIPTNEDLRKTYFWESRQVGAETTRKYALEKRESRLQKLWKAKWHASIKILVQEPTFTLKTVFAVVQGHRFIWWNSVDEFDDGELPLGKLVLSGHAGLGGPSPIEMRELDREKELPLCLSIFGRGSLGQERVTILLLDKNSKDKLENVIIYSASFKSD